MLAATLDWWRGAGVDHAFGDEARGWLADETAPPASPAAAVRKPAAAAPTAAAPATLGGNPATWPASLDDFARWWLTEPTLDPAPAARRVPPMGQAGADLMVLVPTPEQGDEAVLLAGREGKLLDAMLAAMGLSRDRIYLAAALPARVPVPDWPELGTKGIRPVLAHHIMLAAPKKLLILGRSLASTLVDHDPANKSQSSRAFNHDGRSLPVLAGYDLETLLARPALKAGVWKQWLEWTGSEFL